MVFRYELSREDCRRAGVAFQHLTKTWPLIKGGRVVAVLIVIGGLFAASSAVCWGSWTLAACGVAVAGWGGGVRLLLSDLFCRTPGLPQGPIQFELQLEDNGLVLSVYGERHLIKWSAVTRLVDGGWAWLIGVGPEDWVALPVRVISAARRASLRQELTTRTALSFVPLP